MRRNWLFLALLLSVGINCGLLGMGILRHRLLAGSAASDRSDHADRFDHSHRAERPPGRQGARLADRLELAGEERERFLALQRTLAETVHAGRLRIDEARQDMRRELISPQPDRVRIEALLAAIVREQETLDRALVENVLAARELLEGAAEREYLRFVERFGGAFAGGRPPGPGGPGGMRPRFGDRRLHAPDSPPGTAGANGADGSGGSGDSSGSGDSADLPRRPGPDSPR